MPQDWILGLLGGALIGCAGALYLLGAGRIMGASGIVGGLVDGTARNTWAERLLFLVGLVGAPVLVTQIFGLSPATNATGPGAVLIAAGLLVGLGTRLANGCTSGHGVCGISRLSPRGIVASLLYIGAGMATLALLRQAWGLI
ncbi:YeeE/YedE family protein [Tritonibacter horizontis]|uniref:Sulphur transport domain-containing protein n=1 Tax=Tritonibacter horizontis TaxID=1768241 RepID=A0A132BVB4_9RHOB|nr:hypothetical protein [Tritonibacter horizontis]KUP92303.1 hypothetical protein TRIHO_27910 [Tritonibacter horizontis]